MWLLLVYHWMAKTGNKGPKGTDETGSEKIVKMSDFSIGRNHIRTKFMTLSRFGKSSEKK